MSPSAEPMRYRLSMPEPASHEFHVALDIPALPSRRTVDLVFPAWAPGSYMVRDFARHIYDLRVTGEQGQALVCERLDKQRWRVPSGGRPLGVRYRVFAFEPSVRTSFLDDERGFCNGTSLFFFVDGELARPCRLDIEPPRGWSVATALAAVRGARHRFRAGGYDELVDSPVELGSHDRHVFREGGANFEVVMCGRRNADVPRLLADLRRIVRAAGALFGGFPFDRYLFIVHFLPARGGGLEHACSCTLDVAGLAFEDEKAYQSFNALAAHEFFHAWNVKRIRDRVLGPFDYTAENYTRLLWFHEGFTEYMESLVLLHAGLLSPERYLADLAEAWEKYRARPGRSAPLSELSFEAWVKQYKPADNHTNRAVSYYEKGRWAALVLDLMLRQWSGGRRGLPDVFRRLWQRYGSPGRPIGSREIRAAAEAIGRRSLASYFTRFIDGRDELPVPALLRRVGIAVQAQAPAAAEVGDKVRARRLRGWCGLQLGGSGPSQGALVKNVIPGSPAWRAGLTFSDEIVAVDGLRANGATAGKRFADRGPGASVRVTWFRGDSLRSASLRLAPNPERRWSFALAAPVSAEVRRVRTCWLRGW